MHLIYLPITLEGKMKLLLGFLLHTYSKITIWSMKVLFIKKHHKKLSACYFAAKCWNLKLFAWFYQIKAMKLFWRCLIERRKNKHNTITVLRLRFHGHAHVYPIFRTEPNGNPLMYIVHVRVNQNWWFIPPVSPSFFTIYHSKCPYPISAIRLNVFFR